MKKSIFLLGLLAFLTHTLSAQIEKPVTWSFSKRAKGEGKWELHFKATIAPTWHVYSQFLESEKGPVATTFSFENNSSYKRIGKVKEPKSKTEYDANFEMNVSYFEREAEFIQEIEVLSSTPIAVKGYLNFMTCHEGQCLPPTDVDFSFQIEGNPKAEVPAALPGAVPTPNHQATAAIADTPRISKSEKETRPTEDKIAPADQASTNKESSEETPWGIFVAGFLGGLLALLTPCVFPMIPLTVSFFTKQSSNRAKGLLNAFLYAASIIGIYVGLGLTITLSLGPDALNALASNAIMNLAFFIIFFVFALSFLGAFEITLPSSWINRADRQSDKGGLLGIFFMAFTLSLVSFSCTGPIIGSLLVSAAVGGNVLNPALGMFGFSLALALPFGLFAAFPGWLNSLPKSGGWLNSVKVVLGFLELALGLKFLSNVDLAYHWGILTREVFISIWIVLFGLMGLYLLGKFRLSHDSETRHISVGRLLMASLSLSFVVYLIPGLWGAPLKLISGFPPPTFYTEGWNLASAGEQLAAQGGVVPGTDPDHCPHNLNCFHDYDAALAYAKTVNKPLMVDFTGWSCVNCRKMEDKVWVEPMILQMLREDYVLVSLYVDDKTELPKSQQRVSPTTGNKIRTIGNKWSDLETERYKTNTQPFYVLLDHQEKALIPSSGYQPDANLFSEFLSKGLQEYKRRHQPL
jgi:thiol:disulfide interchange protein